jgi:hypothetical protein
VASPPFGAGRGAASGTTNEGPKWDRDGDGVPDVLNDEAERKRLLQKYGYNEDDLKTAAKRKLFYEAVRKEYTRKEAKKAYDEVYVADEATVREIVADSGFSMALIQAYPELRDVFRRLSDMLARGKITEDPTVIYNKFKELLEDTDFGKRTNSEISADLDRYKRGGKNNWEQRVERLVTTLTEFIRGDVGEDAAGNLSDADAQRLAIELIYAGQENDPDALRRKARDWFKSWRETSQQPDAGTEPGLDDTGDEPETVIGGERGRYTTMLMQWFGANGLVVSQGDVDRWLDQLLDGTMSMDQVKQWYRDKKFSVDYAGFADEFARGRDISDIALSYRDTMAQLLEKNIEDVSFDDPLVQRAMQRRGVDGKPAPMTRYEFEREVRSTGEWDKTTNAMSVYTDIGEGILRSFGFRG